MGYSGPLLHIHNLWGISAICYTQHWLAALSCPSVLLRVQQSAERRGEYGCVAVVHFTPRRSTLPDGVPIYPTVFHLTTTVINFTPRCSTVPDGVPLYPNGDPPYPTFHLTRRCFTLPHGVPLYPTVFHFTPRCSTLSCGVPLYPTVFQFTPRWTLYPMVVYFPPLYR